MWIRGPRRDPSQKPAKGRQVQDSGVSRLECQGTSLRLLSELLVRELYVGYHNPETIPYTMYPYYGNL